MPIIDFEATNVSIVSCASMRRLGSLGWMLAAAVPQLEFYWSAVSVLPSAPAPLHPAKGMRRPHFFSDPKILSPWRQAGSSPWGDQTV